jgi:nucleotide-binding universal stress UspA family protein
MYKDLLLPLLGTAADEASLALAAELAEAHDAHLAALVTVPLLMPLGFEMGAVPSDIYGHLHDAERARGRQNAQRARERLGAAPISSEVRVVETFMVPASNVAVVHAHHADLVVLPGGDGTDAQAAALFVDLLTGAGRPVLAVPPKYVPRASRRYAAVAWQPTREAARAVHDALPLLRGAEQIDVLVVDPRVDATHHGEMPGADIAAHLARHGLAVNVVAVPSLGETAAAAILRFVLESGAQLLVAGGYSHSRLREQIMGGVTRSLFAQAPVPVLFSH